MNTFTLIALGLLAAVGFMWRELRRAPLMPPGHDADGQPMKDWRTYKPAGKTHSYLHYISNSADICLWAVRVSVVCLPTCKASGTNT